MWFIYRFIWQCFCNGAIRCGFRKETEEYEDYSSGYWDADWITEYYDNQGVGDKLMYMIRFAEDCVDDMRYQEANEIYEWLWEMSVFTDNEFGDSVDIEVLEDNNLIHTDMKRLALLTLYDVGVKSLWPHDAYGFLRVSRSRNPKNIRNPHIFLRKMATFSCFTGPKVMHFHAGMKCMTFWP